MVLRSGFARSAMQKSENYMLLGGAGGIEHHGNAEAFTNI
jgi:hypothetical protein